MDNKTITAYKQSCTNIWNSYTLTQSMSFLLWDIKQRAERVNDEDDTDKRGELYAVLYDELENLHGQINIIIDLLNASMVPIGLVEKHLDNYQRATKPNSVIAGRDWCIDMSEEATE
ncbi:MAG: hypothetical protein Q4A55_00525 [Aerococcus sp.]|nr:hypothetical protein [Aerococcus sp.]